MGLQSLLSKINKARDEHIKRKEKQAEENLERLKTKTARDKERARLAKERARARAEADKAKTAAIKAETARKEAQRELGRYGLMGQLSGMFSKPKKKRRSKRK